MSGLVSCDRLICKMKLRFLIVLLLIFTFENDSKAQEKYEASSGIISFFSSAPFEDIYAENNQIKSLIDLSTGELAFVVPIPGFVFKKSLMQTHFNKKYLESDKFPNATFTGILIPNSSFDKQGLNLVRVEGYLQIHGVRLKIKETGQISFVKGEVMVTSEFKVRLKDFNIKIPRLVIKNIAEEVLVKVNLTYTRLE